MPIHSITKEFVKAIHAGKGYNLAQHHLNPNELMEVLRRAKIMLGHNFRLAGQ